MNSRRTAAESLQFHRPPSETDKRAIYDELDAWLIETSSDELGDELMNLRNALQTELDLGTKTD